MSSFIMKAALAATVALGTAAQADVLTFDDLPGNTLFFTSNYRGFQFGTNNINNTAWFHTNEISTFYTPKSGRKFVATDFQLYNGLPFEATQPISNALDFTFDGAWFSGDMRVRYELYNNGNLLFTSENSPLLDGVPVFVPSGFAGAVDSVVIVGMQGFWGMDDFTYNLVPIPEPTSLGLLMAGLLGVATAVRRRARC